MSPSPLPLWKLCPLDCREQWDMVVCDPPSFAPSKQAVETGRAAYERVFALAARVTRWGLWNYGGSLPPHYLQSRTASALLWHHGLLHVPASVFSTNEAFPVPLTPPIASSLRPGGLLALASCLSHVPAPMFNELCEEAVLGGARRQATVLAMQVCVRR